MVNSECEVFNVLCYTLWHHMRSKTAGPQNPMVRLVQCVSHCCSSIVFCSCVVFVVVLPLLFVLFLYSHMEEWFCRIWEFKLKLMQTHRVGLQNRPNYSELYVQLLQLLVARISSQLYTHENLPTSKLQKSGLQITVMSVSLHGSRGGADHQQFSHSCASITRVIIFTPIVRHGSVDNLLANIAIFYILHNIYIYSVYYPSRATVTHSASNCMRHRTLEHTSIALSYSSDHGFHHFIASSHLVFVRSLSFCIAAVNDNHLHHVTTNPRIT